MQGWNFEDYTKALAGILSLQADTEGSQYLKNLAKRVVNSRPDAVVLELDPTGNEILWAIGQLLDMWCIEAPMTIFCDKLTVSDVCNTLRDMQLALEPS